MCNRKAARCEARVPRRGKAASSGPHDIDLPAQSRRRIPQSGYAIEQRPRAECLPSSSSSSWELALRAGVAVHTHIAHGPNPADRIRCIGERAARDCRTASSAAAYKRAATAKEPGRGWPPPPPPNLGASHESNAALPPTRKAAGMLPRPPQTKRLRQNPGLSVRPDPPAKGRQLTRLPNTFHTPRWPAGSRSGEIQVLATASWPAAKAPRSSCRTTRWARPATVPLEEPRREGTRGQRSFGEGPQLPGRAHLTLSRRYWQRAWVPLGPASPKRSDAVPRRRRTWLRNHVETPPASTRTSV